MSKVAFCTLEKPGDVFFLPTQTTLLRDESFDSENFNVGVEVNVIHEKLISLVELFDVQLLGFEGFQETDALRTAAHFAYREFLPRVLYLPDSKIAVKFREQNDDLINRGLVVSAIRPEEYDSEPIIFEKSIDNGITMFRSIKPPPPYVFRYISSINFATQAINVVKGKVYY